MVLAIGSFLTLVLIVAIVYASIAVGKESDELMQQMRCGEREDKGDPEPDGQDRASKDAPG